MCDFQQWVHVVEIELPKLKHLDWLGVQSIHGGNRPGPTEQKVVVILNRFIPRLLEYNWSYFII
jgi:hypothetical protein